METLYTYLADRPGLLACIVTFCVAVLIINLFNNPNNSSSSSRKRRTTQGKLY
jgi:hypothetical protein